MSLALSCLMSALIFLMVRGRKGDDVHAIISMLAIVFLLIGWGNLILFRQLVSSIVDPLAVSVWQYDDPALALNIFSIATFALAAGSFLSSFLLGSISERIDFKVGSALVKFSATTLTALLIFGFALELLFIFSYGFSNLISRHAYQPTYAIPALAPYTSLFLLPGAALFAFISSTTRGMKKTLSMLGYLVSLVIAFSTASRLIGLIAILYIGVKFFISRKFSISGAAAAAVIAVYGSALALSDRSGASSAHGLFPYLENVFSSGLPDLSLVGFDLVQNLLFSAPLAVYAEKSGVFDWNSFWVSLSPLPNSNQDWALIAPQLRAHAFIPFNALGEIYSLSPVVLTLCLALIGFVSHRLVSWFALRGSIAFASSLLALFGFTLVLFLQYNTRSAIRVFYALVVAGFLLRNYHRADKQVMSGNRIF